MACQEYLSWEYYFSPNRASSRANTTKCMRLPPINHMNVVRMDYEEVLPRKHAMCALKLTNCPVSIAALILYSFLRPVQAFNWSTDLERQPLVAEQYVRRLAWFNQATPREDTKRRTNEWWRRRGSSTQFLVFSSLSLLLFLSRHKKTWIQLSPKTPQGLIEVSTEIIPEIFELKYRLCSYNVFVWHWMNFTFFLEQVVFNCSWFSLTELFNEKHKK